MAYSGECMDFLFSVYRKYAVIFFYRWHRVFRGKEVFLIFLRPAGDRKLSEAGGLGRKNIAVPSVMECSGRT